MTLEQTAYKRSRKRHSINAAQVAVLVGHNLKTAVRATIDFFDQIAITDVASARKSLSSRYQMDSIIISEVIQSHGNNQTLLGTRFRLTFDPNSDIGRFNSETAYPQIVRVSDHIYKISELAQTHRSIIEKYYLPVSDLPGSYIRFSGKKLQAAVILCPKEVFLTGCYEALEKNKYIDLTDYAVPAASAQHRRGPKSSPSMPH